MNIVSNKGNLLRLLGVKIHLTAADVDGGLEVLKVGKATCIAIELNANLSSVPIVPIDR